MNNLRWEDLVFANRNQAYGAYPLRKAYAGRVTVAFAFAMTVTAMMIAYPIVRKLFDKEVIAVKVVDGPGPVTILPPPPIELIPVVPPPQVRVPVEQIRFVPPVVTQQDVGDLPPTIDDLHNIDPSTQNADGAGLTIDQPLAVEPPPVTEDPEKTWIAVQQRPEFPGGIGEMMKFIAKNIKYPASARRMGIVGIVFISFVVNPDGSIGNIETVKGIYGDCDKEAMRVIGKMPTWKPGKQNGKEVKVKLVLPIKFALSDV